MSDRTVSSTFRMLASIVSIGPAEHKFLFISFDSLIFMTYHFLVKFSVIQSLLSECGWKGSLCQALLQLSKNQVISHF